MKKLAPVGTVIQVSARDNQGRWILSVLAKRTYTFRASGDCLPSVEQSSIVTEPIYDRAMGEVLEADVDVWAYKPLTDVVVKGHAYNHAGRPVFSIGARVGETTKLVQVCGDRRASIGFDGRILFSKPAMLDALPLSYAFAYGGRDAVAEAEHGNPVEALRPYLPQQTADREISRREPLRLPEESLWTGLRRRKDGERRRERAASQPGTP